MGIGMTMALSNAAFAGLSQIAGKDARRALGMLMLFGGMASTVFWPLTLWLDGLIGWRTVCLVYAALHLLVCAPLHWLTLPTDEQRQRIFADSDTDLDGSLPQDARKTAALLMVAIMCCSGFVSWGIDLHIITLLGEFGLGATAAVAIASLKGPAILMARVVDFVSVGRISPMVSAVMAGLLTTLGLLAALMFGRDYYGPLLFVIIFSFGTGLMTIVRATLPLSLLGALGYATTLGRLALPTQIVYAFSPMIFGLVIDAYGANVALSIALTGSLFSLLALLALARLVELRPNTDGKG
jgi:predicted MFS family arabinose efflux permease